MSAAFQYSEALFAEQSGLSRGDAKFLRDRHLREGTDWKKQGGEIVLSASAIKRLWRTLQARPATFDLSACLIVVLAGKNGATEKNGAPIMLGSTNAPIPRKMTVAAIPMNPRVVIAIDEYGERQLVWVGRNSTFVVRDEIEVAPHETQEGFWRLLGPIPRDRRRFGQ